MSAFPVIECEPWPRCFYNPDALCGEPQEKSVDTAWTDTCCRCPSCPLRVAVRDTAMRERQRLASSGGETR